MLKKTIPLSAGLTVVLLLAAPAAGQFENDPLAPLPKALSRQMNYGYQQSTRPPLVNPPPVVTQPYQAGIPNQAGSRSLSGGTASYMQGGSPYGQLGVGTGPVQNFTIYKPGAVAGVPYLAGQAQAQQSTSWPPRGGPWGVGPMPSATPEDQTAAMPGVLAPGLAPNFGVPVPGEQGQPAGEAEDEVVAEQEAGPVDQERSFLDRYSSQSFGTTALYDRYQSIIRDSSSRQQREPRERRSSAERSTTTSAPLGSVYGNRLREAARPAEETQSGPNAKEEEEAPKKQPSLMRYLSPVYRQADTNNRE